MNADSWLAVKPTSALPTSSSMNTNMFGLLVVVESTNVVQQMNIIDCVRILNQVMIPVELARSIQMV